MKKIFFLLFPATPSIPRVSQQIFKDRIHLCVACDLEGIMLADQKMIAACPQNQ